MSVEIIVREINKFQIGQRRADGYVDATALCRAAGKRLHDYTRIQGTIEFLTELEAVTGIPVTELVQIRQGGNPEEQGTWVHPDVAINLAQWLSPQFAVQVSQWVRELLTTGKVELVPSTGDALLDEIKMIQSMSTALVKARETQLAMERSLGETRAVADRALATAQTAVELIAEDDGYWTLLAYIKLRNYRSIPEEEAAPLGAAITRHCKAHAIRVGKKKSGKWGKVNSYPEGVLDQFFSGLFDSSLTPVAKSVLVWLRGNSLSITSQFPWK